MQNQRYFEKDDSPTDRGVLLERRAEARKKFRLDPESSKWIDYIDFEVLSRIFKGLLKRCNLDPKNMNFIGRHEIYLLESEMVGQFDITANLIGLNLEKVKHSQLSERAKQLLVLQILVHEMIHAVGCIELIGYDEEKKNHEEVRLGFATNAVGQALFRGLDEGLTELMAIRITNEYLEESGLMKVSEAEALRKQFPTGFIKKNLLVWLVDIFEKQFPAFRERLPTFYEEEQEMVEEILKVLAKETGVSEEEIFKAFVREKLEGGTDPWMEWKALFTELMGKKKGETFFFYLATAHPKVEGSVKGTRELLKQYL